MEENVKARYSDAELSEFRELIEGKLENARMEFEFINNQISDLNGNNSDRDAGDFMDDSNKQSELEMLNNMVFRQKQFIQNLENALIRIRNKTYGICTVTGQLIDKKRLMLVPHATKSIEGKSGETQIKTPTLNKQEILKRAKPKVITKVVRKPGADSKNEGSVSDEWEDEWEEQGFDDSPLNLDDSGRNLEDDDD